MRYMPHMNCVGLDIKASGHRIGQLIDESGISDKELSRRMNLSVQSINKWRHGKNLPDIENMFLLSRILGVGVDDFLVPRKTQEPVITYEIEVNWNNASLLRRLMAYFKFVEREPYLAKASGTRSLRLVDRYNS